jgi:hypothetical protein
MGLSEHRLRENLKKPGFFAAFPFTSPCPSLMIEIDSGGKAGAACR